MHNYLENSSDASLVIVRKTDLLLKKQENLQTSIGTSSICVININSVSVAPCRCGSKSDSTNMQPLLRFKSLLSVWERPIVHLLTVLDRLNDFMLVNMLKNKNIFTAVHLSAFF